VLKTLFLVLAVSSVSAAEKVRENPKLSALPAGGLLELSAVKVTDPVGEPAGHGRLVTDYSGMAYDPKRHRMLLFGGGHASTNYDGVAALNLKDFSWSEEYPPTPLSVMHPENYDKKDGIWKKGPAGPYPRPAARHTVDLLAVVNDELIVLSFVEGNGRGLPGGWKGADTTKWLGGGNAAQYDLTKKTWTFGNDAEYTWPGSAVDQKTNKILTLGHRGLHIYDPKTRMLADAIDATKVPFTDESGGKLQGSELTYNVSLTYFPPDDSFYYISPNGVFRLKFNRDNPGASTLSKVAATGTPPPERLTQCAYDPANKIIGGGPLDSTFYAFDPKTKEWKSKKLPTPGLRLAWMALDFDPVDNVFVFITEWNNSTGKAYAFRW
jgi:hypothetical protein